MREYTYDGPVLTTDGIINLHVEVNEGLICNIIELGGEVNLDRLLTPALTDVHVHYRDLKQENKETVSSGSLHSLMHGVLYAIAMPNTNPPLDNPHILREYLAKESFISFDVRALLTPNSTREVLESMRDLCKNQYKAFMAESVGSGFFTDNKLLRKKVHELPSNACLWIHCEDPELLKKHAGKWNPQLPESHYDARPPEVEVEAIKYVINNIIPENHDKNFVICHVSTKEGLELVREAKKKHSNLKAETCYQYLYFTRDDFKRKGYNLKCNPSVKTLKDRLALIDGVNDGTINYLSSDHAPHTFDDKWISYASGMPSCNGPVYAHFIKSSEFNPVSLLKAVTLNIKPDWEIKEGNPAMLVEFDMNEQPLEEDKYTKTGISPWINENLPRIKTIIYRNKIITK